MKERNAEERQTYILEILERLGDVQVDELSERLGVSEMTIRRDLDLLQAQGIVTRTHGGAILENVNAVEQPLRVRLRKNLESKRLIGQAASQLIQDGSTIILDSGSTTVQITNHLDRFRNLVVVTNDLNISQSLLSKPGVQVISTGGLARSVTYSLVGHIAERTLKELQVDQVFLAAAGVDPVAGVTNESILEISIKQAMVAAARQVILLADSSKVGRRALAQICPLRAASILVTDKPLSNGARRAFDQAGLRVIVAEKQGEPLPA